MITGTISQLHLYKPIHPRLAKAIEHLEQLDLTTIASGSHAIEGGDIFYMVNEYNTKPAIECEPERHRKYTDIQVMINGAERFGYSLFSVSLYNLQNAIYPFGECDLKEWFFGIFFLLNNIR